MATKRLGIRDALSPVPKNDDNTRFATSNSSAENSRPGHTLRSNDSAVSGVPNSDFDLLIFRRDSWNNNPKRPPGPLQGHFPPTKLHKVVHISKTSDQKLCKNAVLATFSRATDLSLHKHPETPAKRQKTAKESNLRDSSNPNPLPPYRSPSPCTPTLYYPLTPDLQYNLNYLRDLIPLK